MSTQQLKQKGFTIIEVVLVLAIAALIFLMVFIALPALQRNQRDAARKEVLGKVASGVTTYESNKRGTPPSSPAELAGYVDGKKENDGTVYVNNEYKLLIRPFDREGVGAANTDVVQVITGAKCNESADAAVAGSKRNAAVIIKLENGDDFVCQEV